MANEKELTPSSAVQSEEKRGPKKEANKADEYRVSVPLLNIREKASLTSVVIGTLLEDEVVSIVSRTPQGFGKLSDGSGYIKLEFVEKIDASEMQK